MSERIDNSLPFQLLPEGTVTFLFTDIEGSTELLKVLGDQYSDLLADQRRILRNAFASFHGQEVDTQGDAFFYAFQRATEAVNAAVDAQRALAAHAWPKDAEVRVRMGLHTGEPLIVQESYVGMDVHRAARIAHVGHGGQVLLSETTVALVRDDLPEGLDLLDLGLHRLKDLRRSRRIHQLNILGLPSQFPALKSLDVHLHNLPIQPTPLIGREKALRKTKDLINQPDTRLLTLTGPGGIGKTRLGLQLAVELLDDFPDGVFFIPLTPISDPDLVIPTIAQTLGVREGGDMPLLETLIQSYKEKRALLLLDNFEHVIDAAPHIAQLLERCSEIKIIATSREILHLAWEHEFLVEPLALPDMSIHTTRDQLSRNPAVILFTQRAKAIQHNFAITDENAMAVSEICDRLDGLPLAIELAAARVKVLPPSAILKRFEEADSRSSLHLLSGGARDAPERHRTIQATIDWSYNLLPEDEKNLFRILSIFSGGFTLPAAEEVCFTQGIEIMDGLSSLLNKSLIRRDESETEARYFILEMIRAYAQEELESSGQEEEIRWRHANYFLSLAEDAKIHLQGPEQSIWLEILEREINNLRSALQWFLDQVGSEILSGKDAVISGLRMAAALARFWDTHGYVSEGRRWLSKMLQVSDTPSIERVDAIIGVAWFAIRQEGSSEVIRYYEEGLNLARSLGYTTGIAQALDGLAYAHNLEGADDELLQSLHSESLELWRQLGDKRGIASALGPLAHRASSRYAFDEATVLFEESLSLFQEVGDQREIAGALWNLGQINLRSGKYERSNELFRESLSLYEDLKDSHGIATQLRCLAEVERIQGNLKNAKTLYEDSLVTFRAIEDKSCASLSLTGLSKITLNRGDPTGAFPYVEEGLEFARAINNRHVIAENLHLLGLAELARGNLKIAEVHIRKSMQIALELDSKEIIATNLEGIAKLATDQNDYARATQLFSSAEALRNSIGIPTPPVEIVDLEKWKNTIQMELDDAAFETAWQVGQEMPLDQTIDFAMKG